MYAYLSIHGHNLLHGILFKCFTFLFGYSHIRCSSQAKYAYVNLLAVDGPQGLLFPFIGVGWKY
jgi:hypothetical protein